MNKILANIQSQIDEYKKNNPGESVGELSDSYHSFNDLYEHRTVLTALAFLMLPYAWKSRVHEDGTMFEGMFVVGAVTPTGMITYHYDDEYWNLFKIPELPHAPVFDGYTDKDVLDRIKNYIKCSTTRLLNEESLKQIEKIVEDQILPVFGDDLISKAAYIGFYNR